MIGLLSGPNGEPVQNLVSMYRKRGRDAAKTKYEGDPQFADGTNSRQWFESEGCLNMGGNYIGPPGRVHQDTHDSRGRVEFKKDPASLPEGSSVINNIFHGGTDATDLRWVELHNTSDSDVIVKNYEMDTAQANGENKGKISRVFHQRNSTDNVKVLAGAISLSHK